MHGTRGEGGGGVADSVPGGGAGAGGGGAYAFAFAPARALGLLAAPVLTVVALLGGGAPNARAAEPIVAVLVARGDVPPADAAELAAALEAAGAYRVLGYGVAPAGARHPEADASRERARALLGEGEKLFYDLRYDDAVKRLAEAQDILAGGEVPLGETEDLVRAVAFRAAAELGRKRRDDAAAILRPLLHAWRDVPLDEKLFSPMVVALADELRAEIDPAATGALVVASAPAGVPLYVDGLRRGETGTTPAGGLAEGKHAVVVWRPGLAPWRSELTMARGAVVTLSTPLGPPSIGARDGPPEALEVAARVGADAALIVETATRGGLPYVTVSVATVSGTGRFGGAPARDAAGLFALARYLAGGPADPLVTTNPSDLDRGRTGTRLERKLGLVALALGAGAVAVSFGVGAGAMNNAAAAEMRLDDMPRNAVDLRHSAERLADIATGMFVAGAAIAAAGAVLVVLYPGPVGTAAKSGGAGDGESKPSGAESGPAGTGKVELLPAPRGAALRVTF